MCRGRAGAPDRGARRADGHSPQGRGRIRHGGPRVRVCVSGWCETKQTRHSTDGRHCGQQQTTARGGTGGAPLPTNGEFHTFPKAMASVTGHAPEPTSQTPQRAAPLLSQCLNHRQPPSHGDHNKRQPGGGQGARLAVPLTPRRHSPHATHHCGKTWCTPSATGSREGPMAGRAL